MLALALMGAGPPRAHLHGVVIGIDARSGSVLVRHDAFGGMPGMTMPFAVSPNVLARLHPRDVIDATVEQSGSPWRLEAVRIVSQAPSERYVPVMQIGDIVPGLPLVDQTGRPFSFAALGGRAAVVAFIYTRCADAKMCPLVSAKFARLQHMIDPKTTRLVEVTLDPAFDTPAVLKRYGSAFGALADRWTFATGRAADVDELSRRMGIVSTPGERGVILHSEALVVLDPDGRIADRVDGNTWTAEQALSVTQAALHRRANPLALLGLALTSGIAGLCGGGTSGVTLAAAIAIFLCIAAALGYALFRAFRSALS